MEQLAALMALGAIAGLFSGLLGIGGGFIIVPAMVFMMPHFGMAGPDLVRVAIATAMATTVVATFSGVQSHLARGAVDWSIMWRLTPGVMVGAFAGPLISEAINAQLLAILFVGFLLFAARSMVRRRAAHQTARQLPGVAGLLIVGISYWRDLQSAGHQHGGDNGASSGLSPPHPAIYWNIECAERAVGRHRSRWLSSCGHSGRDMFQWLQRIRLSGRGRRNRYRDDLHRSAWGMADPRRTHWAAADGFCGLSGGDRRADDVEDAAKRGFRSLCGKPAHLAYRARCGAETGAAHLAGRG